MFKICILGSSSAIPVFGRHMSAQMLMYNDRYYLLDCGEATQFQIQTYKLKVKRLDAIFISHLHGDHVYGLPGLLTTLSLSSRTNPLLLVGPKGIKTFLYHQFSLSESSLNYPLEVVELDHQTGAVPVFEIENLLVSAFPLEHQIPCYGYLFSEQAKKRKFLYYKAMEMGLPKEYFHLIKQGVDVEMLDGPVFKADDFLADPEKPIAYAYCTDTRFTESFLPYIKDCTAMYHEATFLDEHEARAAETYHSTARQAANVAKLANAKSLIIGHFSARYYDLQQHLFEARTVFPATNLALEGAYFTVLPDEN